MKKRILILNPNTSEESAKQMAEECRKVAAPGTEVVSTYIRPRQDFSSYAVLCYVDMAICAMEAVKLAWKERKNVDGIVVAGFSDVGLDAMKELLDIPVIGIAEAAYHVASLLGHRFAVLTGTSKWTPPKHDYVKAVGVESKAVSFRSYSEWDEISSHEVLKNKLVEAARKSIEEDGAEVIILGGGPLAGYGKEVEKEIGVPVIDPAINAFKLLEGLIDLGLKQSKICRWKKPMETLGDIPYNRRWLDTD